MAIDPYWKDDSVALYQGDATDVMLNGWPKDTKVQCIVTSPPYFGLRDYGEDGQIGLEPTPDEYIKKLVSVFRVARHFLADDGTLWVNIGDSYSGSGKGPSKSMNAPTGGGNPHSAGIHSAKTYDGIKAKDLIGIPWMLAFALRADGWYLRQDIIWAKPNPMPESVRDRCTRSHEYIFMLSKSKSYYYDHEAIKEPAITAGKSIKMADGWDTGPGGHGTIHRNGREQGRANNGTQAETRNKRDVWTVPTRGFPGAHFATFPVALIEPCILAGSRAGDVVFDPFSGSGTTAWTARSLGRRAIGIDLGYTDLQVERMSTNPIHV